MHEALCVGAHGRSGWGWRCSEKGAEEESAFYSQTLFLCLTKQPWRGWFLGVRERPICLHTFAEEHQGAVMRAGINEQFYYLPVRRVM